MTHLYFWRTWDQQKIDWMEDRGGILYGYEFKWSKQKVSVPKDWLETYEHAKFEVIHQDNYLSFVIDE